MRKYTLFIIFAGLISSLNAQAFLGITGGYGFPILQQQIAVDASSSPSGYTVYNGLYGSLGAGLQAEFSGGYIYREHFILQVAVGATRGNEIATSFTDTTDSQSTNKIERTAQVSGARVTPSIGYIIGGDRLQFFSKTGLVIGFGMRSQMTRTEMRTYNFGSPFEYRTADTYSGGAVLGLQQRAGVQIALVKNLFFTAEVYAQFLNWKPKIGETTESYWNGVDQLAGSNYSDYHYEFVTNYTSPNLNQNVNSRSERLQPILPLSAGGFQFGLTYSI